MEKINILTSADDNYAQHLGVTVISVLENSSIPEELRFVVLDGDISCENKDTITGIVNKYGAEINFIPFSLDESSDFVVDGHISAATYFRLFLPQFFEHNIEKIVYIDCDLVVNADIKEFYSYDVTGKVMGAIKEPAESRIKDLKLKGGKYFNAGVLLINFQEWLKQDITKKSLEYYKVNKDNIIYHDQDILNGVLDKNWVELPTEWNYTRVYVETNKDWRKWNPKKSEPKLAHYTNNTKPWHYYSRNPYDYLYFKYLALSPWKDFTPIEKTLKRIVIKKVKVLMQKLRLKDSW